MFRACGDFSVIFVLWRHHSCKLSLCNGEAVVPAPCWGSVSDLQPPCPFLLIFPIFALSPSPIRPTCDCDQGGDDAFKAGRGRVLSLAFKRGWRFLPTPQWNPLRWICNEHNLQDVILILYLSAFVCKLSIMEKKEKESCMHLFLVLSWDDFA